MGLDASDFLDQDYDPSKEEYVQKSEPDRERTREKAAVFLQEVERKLGMDRLQGKEAILDEMVEDVVETPDPEHWNSEDIKIAFKRYIDGSGR